MALSKLLEDLATDGLDADGARAALAEALSREGGHEDAYAALARWTWRSLTERRLDDGLRDWHRLILDAAAKAGHSAKGRPAREPSAAGRHRHLEPEAVRERLRAFADLVRESIRAAEAGTAESLAGRAHVREILRMLAAEPQGPLRRADIKAKTGLEDSNLSRVLTLLAANGAVERTPLGREAAFAITSKGRSLCAPGREEASTTRPIDVVIAKPGVESRADAVEDHAKPLKLRIIEKRPDGDVFPAELARLLKTHSTSPANENRPVRQREPKFAHA